MAVEPSHSILNLPLEIRRMMYLHLFSKLHIVVTKDGNLDTSYYNHRIAAVCRQLHAETVPYLQQPNPLTPLHLLCEHGRFPHVIRQRLPSHIYRAIQTIVIVDEIRYDEIKPKLTSFPHLQLLFFDMNRPVGTTRADLEQRRRPIKHGMCFRKCGSDEEVCGMSGHAARRMLLQHLQRLHVEQEQPREGLERDYFPEHTLWEVVTKKRMKRGFGVEGWLSVVRMLPCDDDTEDHCAMEYIDALDMDLEGAAAH